MSIDKHRRSRANLCAPSSWPGSDNTIIINIYNYNNNTTTK